MAPGLDAAGSENLQQNTHQQQDREGMVPEGQNKKMKRALPGIRDSSQESF